jgi:antitoxin component of MazEF toxin-antitoxin module
MQVYIFTVQWIMIETQKPPVTTGRRRRKEAMERRELLKVEKALLDALPPDLVKQYNLTEGSYLKIDTGEEGFTIKPVAPETNLDDMAWTMALIQEAQEEQARNPMTDAEILEESRQLAEYGAEQARKLGIDTSDENIQNIIYAYREKQQRSQSGA